MHRDRNNYSWSELKAKKNHNDFDDAPLNATKSIQDDLIGTADSRKEKNDRAARQLNGVKNMFKDMADFDRKQNNSAKNKFR